MPRWFLTVLLCLAASTAPAAPKLLVLGDSLSAAYGIDREQGWVALLAQRLERQGYPHRVVNASISGETTRGALTRLPRLLEQHRPELVVVALGGNDGLRGLAPTETRANLAAIIEHSQEAGARALLLGIRLPPNYGSAYTALFERIFRDLAKEHEVPLVPFLLEGIATRTELMQDDGIHPTAQAQPLMLNLVWPELEALLEKAPASAQGED